MSLATQAFLPLFAKSDWMASSFSPDGRFLLVVDETRSFIVDVVDGRELRSIQLPKGDSALWSRAVPPSGPDYRWMVTTREGRLLQVDGRTGAATTLRSFPPTAAHIKYRDDEFVFEFVSPSTVVVLLNRRSEHKSNGTTRTTNDRKLLRLSLSAGSPEASASVADALYDANLTNLLAVNREARYIALASREGTRVLVWRFDPLRTSSAPFSLACVYDGSEKLRAITPFGQGFVVFNTVGKARVLDPQEWTANTCTVHRPIDPASVRCGFDASVAAFAGRGRTPKELFVVDNDYAVVRLTADLRHCVFERTALGNVKQAFFSAPIFKPSDLTAKLVPEWNGFAAAPLGDAVTVVAGTSLVRLDRSNPNPVMVQSLAGRPTGAVEVETGPNFILASRSLAPVRTFDVVSGQLRTHDYDYRRYLDEAWFFNKPFAIVSGLGAIVILERDGQLRFHESLASVDTTQLPRPQKLAITSPSALCASSDGRRLWVLSAGNTVTRFDLDEQGKFSKIASLSLGEHHDAFKIACDSRGASAVVADSLSDAVVVFEASHNTIRQAQTLNVPGSSKLMVRPSLSGDSSLLAVGPYLFFRTSIGLPFRRHGRIPGANRLVFNPQADRLAAFGPQSKLYSLSRAGGEVRLSSMPGHLGMAEDGAFLGEFLVVLRDADQLEAIAPDGAALGKSAFGDQAVWLFTDGRGRFDTYDPEGAASAYWVMRDDPMRALDPELFMRDYLEPRLLPRLMECKAEEARRPEACTEAFASIRPVDTLNRARPDIEFLGVEPGPNNTVTVRLRVFSTQETAKPANTDSRRSSGAFDLHLRLNGQLVARRPAIGAATALKQPMDVEWRDRSQLLSGSGSTEVIIPGIRLPHRERAGEVEFSAYAFNNDRVKGPTRTRQYSVPAANGFHRRAFVVAIGSSAYEDEALDLRYPANDARKLIDTVVPSLRATNRFAEVIPILLTSEWEGTAADRRVVKAATTKERIRQVLESISGSVRDPGVAYSPSTPDDTVIVLFSGHGLNLAQEFYLVPYNSGLKSAEASGRPILDPGKLVSSSDLAYWLRDLVADDVVLVIDACHSSASVETADFKPGPMGARGFGQLAYDKGMRVLASTRPNDLAWESQDKSQGLLSYALLQEGLAERKADRRPSDGAITMGEWLQYAVDRVPALYGETSRSGALGAARLVTFDPASRQAREVSVNGRQVQAKNQQPSAFSFRRGQDTTLSVPVTKRYQ
ncbi:caspase family protein [Variovorax sp. W6]|uniref:caspase family protein n=1 Tax=Variovorax sp. W6 TaxID=3093895 RepID=UPI003D8094EA